MPKRKFSFAFLSKEGSAFMVGTHVVGGILAGAMLGFVFDGFFNTSPWGLVVGFLLGVIAGLRNAYRELERVSKEDQRRR